MTVENLASLFEQLLDAYPVVVTGRSQLVLCRKWFSNAKVLSLDCEGKCLGRKGDISIIQLANTHGSTCLFDLLGSPDPDVIAFLRELLEDERITKVIHDCRADSDALFHHFGIKLAGVHDTQAWHCALHPESPRLNLNNMLQHYNCPTNADRDTNVYKEDPAFWCRRPLTQAMIAWAAQDVHVLHDLYRAQLQQTSSMGRKCQAASEAYACEMRDAVIEAVPIEQNMIGKLLGKGGANIKRMAEASGARLNLQDDGQVLVVATHETAMRKAVRELAKYRQGRET